MITKEHADELNKEIEEESAVNTDGGEEEYEDD